MPNWATVTPDDWEKYQEDMEEISRFYFDSWIDSIESAEQNS
jgi:hypothetical protein